MTTTNTHDGSATSYGTANRKSPSRPKLHDVEREISGDTGGTFVQWSGYDARGDLWIVRHYGSANALPTIAPVFGWWRFQATAQRGPDRTDPGYWLDNH